MNSNRGGGKGTAAVAKKCRGSSGDGDTPKTGRREKGKRGIEQRKHGRAQINQKWPGTSLRRGSHQGGNSIDTRKRQNAMPPAARPRRGLGGGRLAPGLLRVSSTQPRTRRRVQARVCVTSVQGWEEGKPTEFFSKQWGNRCCHRSRQTVNWGAAVRGGAPTQ